MGIHCVIIREKLSVRIRTTLTREKISRDCHFTLWGSAKNFLKAQYFFRVNISIWAKLQQLKHEWSAVLKSTRVQIYIVQILMRSPFAYLLSRSWKIPQNNVKKTRKLMQTICSLCSWMLNFVTGLHWPPDRIIGTRWSEFSLHVFLCWEDLVKNLLAWHLNSFAYYLLIFQFEVVISGFTSHKSYTALN